MKRTKLLLPGVALAVAVIAAVWYPDTKPSQPSSPTTPPTASANQSSYIRSEVHMPQMLTLQSADPNAQGITEVNVLIDSAIGGPARVEIRSPQNLQFVSGSRVRDLVLTKGTGEQTEKINLDLRNGDPVVVHVRLQLLNNQGTPGMTFDQILKFNQPASDPQVDRVPVVHTRPDGRKVVVYMTRAQAIQQGYGANGRPDPSTPPTDPDHNHGAKKGEDE